MNSYTSIKRWFTPVRIGVYVTAAIAFGLLLFHYYYFYQKGFGVSTSINYPYVLSVKPKVVDPSYEVTISYSISDAKLKGSDYRILVVDPLGKLTSSKANETNDEWFLSYPQKNETRRPEGNYSILLVSALNNTTVNSLSFNVVPVPYLYSVYNFATGLGLTITIGLIASIVTTIYEWLTTRNAERNRKLTEKSTWIIENTKTYLELAYASKGICDCFRPVKVHTNVSRATTNNPKIDFFYGNDLKLSLEFNPEIKNKSCSKNEEILFDRIVAFFRAYRTFKENISFYYFDNVMAEDFLNTLAIDIFEKYNEIGILQKIDEYLELNTSKNTDLITRLLVDKESQDLIQELSQTFSPTFNRELYLDHLLYGIVLIVSVNDGALVTYSDPKGVQKTLRHWVREILGNQYEEQNVEMLKHYLNTLNHRFYGQEEDEPIISYSLTLDNRNILKKRLWDRLWYGRSFWVPILLVAVAVSLISVFLFGQLSQ